MWWTKLASYSFSLYFTYTENCSIKHLQLGVLHSSTKRSHHARPITAAPSATCRHRRVVARGRTPRLFTPHASPRPPITAAPCRRPALPWSFMSLLPSSSSVTSSAITCPPQYASLAVMLEHGERLRLLPMVQENTFQKLLDGRTCTRCGDATRHTIDVDELFVQTLHAKCSIKCQHEK